MYMVVDSHVTDELDQLNKIMKKTRLDREKKKRANVPGRENDVTVLEHYTICKN